MDYGTRICSQRHSQHASQNGYEVGLFVNKEVDQRKTEEILGERVSSSVKIIVKPTFLQPRCMLDLYQIMLLYGS